jgi:hypothetical protein
MLLQFGYGVQPLDAAAAMGNFMYEYGGERPR